MLSLDGALSAKLRNMAVGQMEAAWSSKLLDQEGSRTLEKSPAGGFITNNAAINL